jgi:hypothetical protein
MRQYGVPYRITSQVTDFTDGRVVEWWSGAIRWATAGGGS